MCQPIAPSVTHLLNTGTTDTIASRWWEEAAGILAERQTGWFHALLSVLHGDKCDKEQGLDSNSHEANEIVSLSTGPSTPPAWDGEWVLPAISYPTDATIIAKTFDENVCKAFGRINFYSFVRIALGYEDADVSRLLDGASNSRNDLARCFRESTLPRSKGTAVVEALQGRHPLARWLLLDEVSPDPYKAFSFLCDPIRQLFATPRGDLMPILKRLRILSVRFHEEIVCASDVNWHTPFSTEFYFLEAVERHPPENMAKFITNNISEIYRRLSPADFLDNHSRRMVGLTVTWSSLCDNAQACLIADTSLEPYLKRVADEFVQLQNDHSATALGMGLWKGGFRLTKPWPTWSIINPENNFAGYQTRSSELPCLLYLPPHIKKLRQSGNAPEQLHKIFRYVYYFGGNQTTSPTGGQEAGRLTVRYSPNQTEYGSSLPQTGNSCTPSQLQQETTNRTELQQDQEAGREGLEILKTRKRETSEDCDVSSELNLGDLLYQNVTPGPDGFYHCPWEGEEGCHQPTKSETHYNNLVNGHLKPKPYYCITCKERFSSSHNLARHKREAHGKETLCKIESCDRGVPGKGFHRKTNLNGHVQRMHNDPGPTSSALSATTDLTTDTSCVEVSKGIVTPLTVDARQEAPTIFKKEKRKLSQSTASPEAIARTSKRKRDGISCPPVTSADPKIGQCVLTNETKAGRSAIEPVRKIAAVAESDEHKEALNIFPASRVKSCDGCRAQKLKCNRHSPCENCRRQDRICSYERKPLRVGRPHTTYTFDKLSNELHCKENKLSSITLHTSLSQSPPIQCSNSQSNLSTTAISLDVPRDHPAPVVELPIKSSPHATELDTPLGDQVIYRERYPYSTLQPPHAYNNPPPSLDSVNMLKFIEFGSEEISDAGSCLLSTFYNSSAGLPIPGNSSESQYTPWMYTMEGGSNPQFCETSIPSRNRAGNFTSGQILEGEGNQPSTTTHHSQITPPENEAYSEPPPNWFSMLSHESTIQSEDWMKTDIYALQSIPTAQEAAGKLYGH